MSVRIVFKLRSHHYYRFGSSTSSYSSCLRRSLQTSAARSTPATVGLGSPPNNNDDSNNNNKSNSTTTNASFTGGCCCCQSGLPKRGHFSSSLFLLQRRWMTTTTTTTTTTTPKEEKEGKDEGVEEEYYYDDNDESELLYEGPMASLITSLKGFSLTSAFVSIVGLPAIMIYRGLDTFESVHTILVATTMMGSMGSTIALQWVFAPYIYTLEKISQPPTTTKTTIRQQEKEKKSDDDNSSFLLKATTKSIFLTKVYHVFDPNVDLIGIDPHKGTMRPFCSFFINTTTPGGDKSSKQIPLYIHEQMINDPKLNLSGLYTDTNKTPPIIKQKNPDPDDEFL